jgi:sulfite reductase alpha subunit-like flavoprotein
VAIAVECGGMTDDAARAFLDQLVADRRYLVDVWASN